MTWTFFNLKASALVSPSSSTQTLPGLMVEVGATTIPDRLLYFEDAADVRRIVVTAVPDGGVGITLPSCIISRTSMAFALPCIAAN